MGHDRAGGPGGAGGAARGAVYALAPESEPPLPEGAPSPRKSSMPSSRNSRSSGSSGESQFSAAAAASEPSLREAQVLANAVVEPIDLEAVSQEINSGLGQVTPLQQQP